VGHGVSRKAVVALMDVCGIVSEVSKGADGCELSRQVWTFALDFINFRIYLEIIF